MKKRPAKGSPPAPAAATLPRKKKPARAKIEVGEDAAVMMREIEAAKFDDDGFRVLSREMIERRAKEELFLFPVGSRPENLRRLLVNEMVRECSWAFDFARDLWSGTLSAEIWPSEIAGIVALLSPLPFWERYASEEEAMRALVSRQVLTAPAIEEEKELGAVAGRIADLRDLQRVFPLHRGHWIEINWEAGREVVRRELIKWLKTVRPKNLIEKRGRNSAPDRLHALAAYRAKRAGFDYEGFHKLLSPFKTVWIYSDQPQFLRACREAEKRLRNFDARMRRVIAEHRESHR